MSKMLKKNSLFGQPTLLAMSLAASVIAFGCTTDRTLGNGHLGGRSGVPMAPTSGVTSGSETEPTPTLPPPMTSSYSRSYSQSDALPRVSRSVRQLSADEAAMLMADHKPKYRVLGPANPALSGNLYRSANLGAGQSRNPAMTTYNSSLTPRPTGAIVNDAATNTSPITPVSTTAPVRVVSTSQGVTITNQQ